jgi:hypothetical protein
MTSAIDPTKPGTPQAYTVDMRSNFSAAKSEIEALQGGAAQVTATGSTTPRLLTDRFADRINAADFGVIADGVTDNSAAMQAAINALQTTVWDGQTRTLYLPGGRILTGPLTITGQITIEGTSSAGSAIVLKNGATAAAITITPGGAFPGGVPYGAIVLRTLRIENQTTKAGSAAAHGIQLIQTTQTYNIYLEDVTIYAMPGDGINAQNFLGSLDGWEIMIFNNQGNGINANSCTDWHFYGGQIGVNGAAGVLLSGCGYFDFHGTNIYSNATSNLYLFANTTGGANHNFINCEFDRGSQRGVFYDLRGTGAAKFVGCTFMLCSGATPNTYSDVVISSGANNLATFTGCYWLDNYATNPANPEKWTLEFQGTTNWVTLDGTQYFMTSGVLQTNAPGQVRGPAFSGNVTQGNNTLPANLYHYFNTLAGYSRQLNFQTGGVTRWGFGVGTGAETGSNAGSDVFLNRYDDTGTYLGTAFTVTRSTGAVLIPNANITGGAATGLGQLTMRVTAQYGGLSIQNSSTTTASIVGYSATGDVGVLALNSGGTTMVSLSAGQGYAVSFINVDLWFGNGSSSATPGGRTLRATDGSGTNIAGANIGISSGRSTGSANAGDIIFYGATAGASGTALNANVEAMRIVGATGMVQGTTGMKVGGASGPTWTSGTGVPATTQPVGSLFSRTDGAVGTTLYVSRGAGTWNAVAGV